jgi:hypothetical protein
MNGERIFRGRPSQIGIVVPDVEAAIERYRALHGYDDWLVVENGPWNLHGLHVRGDPADRHGAGLHHLGYEVVSVDEAIAAMAQAGFACLQHGYGFGADGSGGFAYFDTERELGYLVEALEPANE